MAAGSSRQPGAGRPAPRASGVRDDPFGATPSEQRWRRLAGAGLTTLLLVGALLWWVPLVPLVGSAVLYVVGIPASFLLERRWPTATGRSPVPRYVLLGALVGLGVAVGLAIASLSGGDLWGWTIVFAVFTVPAGAVSGGSAAWGARVLPDRWLQPVALVAPVVALALTLAVTITRAG